MTRPAFPTGFTYRVAIPFEAGVSRRDPSPVLKVGNRFHVWYSKSILAPDGYGATVWHATSPDGLIWTERDEAIPKGAPGAWDAHGVFTPTTIVADGKYYLIYTAVPDPFTNDNGASNATRTAFGIVSADSPDGPWQRFAANPILRPSDEDGFDSHRIDDACVVRYRNSFWLYFKGRQKGKSWAETKAGVAFATHPTGPYEKYAGNPVLDSGHEVCVWPHGDGVAALISGCGPQKLTVQYAPDGLHFKKISDLSPPGAPGPYRADHYQDGVGPVITWGLCHEGRHGWPFLQRFDCEFSPCLTSRSVEAETSRELHVATTGDDANAGSAARMLKTISAAARLARPGDVITVHAGIYRERINPPCGGVTYQAAVGETVVITGAEIIRGWEPVGNDTWQVRLPNSFFGAFNPYNDLIRGDWFDAKGRPHHTGAVYLNGEWLSEAAGLDEVENSSSWFAQVDAGHTTIWANFQGQNPNAELVEINVRQTVFYPTQTGINDITVRGFTLCQAATPWAPPTAEQIGLIGTHWSKGWIIENNFIHHSRCAGIALGKYGDRWDNDSATAKAYNLTIERALKHGWNKETIGHHVVRNNTIAHCEQTGIVGSLGCAFSTITGNTIHDIHVQQLFGGAEMAGIKFHGAVDVTIQHNHIYRSNFGIWLDWMAQGAQVTGNLLHDNAVDLFFEVNHGPLLVANNLFLSAHTLDLQSQGTAFVHNLIAGVMKVLPANKRQTPFHPPHSTSIVALHDNPRGDSQLFNNLFVQRGDASQFDDTQLPVAMAGNVFLDQTKSSRHESAPFLHKDFDSQLRLLEKADGYYLQLILDPAGRTPAIEVVLRQAQIPDVPFENPDGTPARVVTDYFGNPRNPTHLFPGPFELSNADNLELKVW